MFEPIQGLIFYANVSHFYVGRGVRVQLIKLLMDNFKDENPESPEDILQKMPVLSSYAKGLENHIKERYLKKISVVGVDPAALVSEQLSPECLLQ